MKQKSKCTPEEWEKQLENRRTNYAKNLESERKRSRESKRLAREQNAEAINKKQRRIYKRDPNAAQKQLERRHKREPHRLIRAAAKLYAEGTITSEQLNQRINDAIAWSDQTTIGTGIGGQKPLGVEHWGCKAEHGDIGKIDSDKS